MKTVLVTGASGFVGAHVVAALAQKGVRPRCLVRPTSRLDFIREWSPELVEGDVTSRAALEDAVTGVDGIVHCAGLTRAPAPTDYLRINAEGCENLYQACLTRNPAVRQIVHISSLAALGPSGVGCPTQEDQERHPVSAYGQSKLAGQRVSEVHRASLPIAILIPPAVYGPFDKDFLQYFRWVKRGLSPLIGGPARHLSLIYAKDLARAALLCLEREPARGQAYLVEDGSPQTWETMALAIGWTMGKTPKPVRVPPAIIKGLAVVMESAARWTGQATLFSRDKLEEFLQPSWVCSSAKIRAELGFVPQYSLAQGLDETYRWYREHHWL